MDETQLEKSVTKDVENTELDNEKSSLKVKVLGFMLEMLFELITSSTILFFGFYLLVGSAWMLLPYVIICLCIYRHFKKKGTK